MMKAGCFVAKARSQLIGVLGSLSGLWSSGKKSVHAFGSYTLVNFILRAKNPTTKTAQTTPLAITAVMTDCVEVDVDVEELIYLVLCFFRSLALFFCLDRVVSDMFGP